MSETESHTKPNRSLLKVFTTITLTILILATFVYVMTITEYSESPNISGTETEGAALAVLTEQAATVFAADIPSFFHAPTSTKIIKMKGSISEWDEFRSPNEPIRLFEVNGEFDTPNQAGIQVRVYCKATLEFNIEREWKYRAILLQDCPKNVFSSKGYEFANTGILIVSYPDDVMPPPASGN